MNKIVRNWRKKMENWITEDNHAGGVTGIILGIAFIVIGGLMVGLREEKQAVPFHRKLMGALLLFFGLLSAVTGSVYLSK